jgi:hypothetical protein
MVFLAILLVEQEFAEEVYLADGDLIMLLILL